MLRACVHDRGSAAHGVGTRPLTSGGLGYTENRGKRAMTGPCCQDLHRLASHLGVVYSPFVCHIYHFYQARVCLNFNRMQCTMDIALRTSHIAR